MPKQPRCLVCNRNPVPEGRRKTCGEACAAKRQTEQIAAANLRKQQERAEARKRFLCKTCGKPIRDRRGPQKYHPGECAARGLAEAVERQRMRRLARQQDARQSKTPDED